MLWVFLAAAILGGAFLVPMLLGGLDTDVDLGGDLDADGDFDLDAESSVDHGDGFDIGENALSTIFATLISVRSFVFFSAFFGTSGLVFDALGYSTAVTLATAVLIGAVAAAANSALFGLIKNSQSSSQISDRTLEGRRAKVVLPMDGSHKGRIRIDLSGQPQYIVAKPLELERFDVGASVVVVRIENGTALVSSLAELDSGEK